jgi:hypothetical protein
MAWKNGLQGQLPADHPYKDSPPGGGVVIPEFDQLARLYRGCIGIYGTTIYYSDGVSWKTLPHTKVPATEDLDPSTATLDDIRDAYNNLLVNLKVTDWMDS